MVDPGEEPRVAAARELEEETGYRAGHLEPIGEVHPNPALFSNRMTFWLATGLERVAEAPHGDEDEELEVLLVPLDDIPRRIREGEITHSLPICAFYFLQQAR
jgi:8-oxo-dGTP pyrophosphatase MutT (NUDIX family)